MSKPREFWLLENRCNIKTRCLYSESDAFENMHGNDDIIHVIEKLAYDKLESANNALLETLSCIITKYEQNRSDPQQRRAPAGIYGVSVGVYDACQSAIIQAKKIMGEK